ncbi:hypothetical protein [Pectobacterium polaris]|uniref:hypothetical protein n=1 Tax=Pectobacterium polaris TaxID=2042057 RepID=UPI0015832DA2|nr:hypothetical protein [Pectobacterium polaris]
MQLLEAPEQFMVLETREKTYRPSAKEKLAGVPASVSVKAALKQFVLASIVMLVAASAAKEKNASMNMLMDVLRMSKSPEKIIY